MRHNQQPHHEPIYDPLHTVPVRKKYYHGLDCDSWETPYTPCHPCPGTVNSSKERAGSWGHRHLKIAATKTPESESTSSWWFQQKSPSKAKPSTWEMPSFSGGWWCTYDWQHRSQQLKISKIVPTSCTNCKVEYTPFSGFSLNFLFYPKPLKNKVEFYLSWEKAQVLSRAGAITV